MAKNSLSSTHSTGSWQGGSPQTDSTHSLDSPQGGMARLTVRDTGVGIRADTLPKLFQKFSRAEDANKANILGTGLGLYVAKKLIEAQKGRIWAESAGEGKGATFSVELPIK